MPAVLLAAAGRLVLLIGVQRAAMADLLDLRAMLIASTLVSLVTMAGGALVALALSAALVVAAHDGYLGRGVSAWRSYRSTLRALGRALTAAILAALLAGLPAITIVGSPLALYLVVCWAFLGQVALIEGTGGLGALRRSRALVRGSWWRVAAVLLTILLMVALVSLVPAWVLSRLVAGLLFAGLAMPTLVVASLVAVLVIATLVGCFALPIFWIATTVLYYDLRVRREAFDLVVRAQALETPG